MRGLVALAAREGRPVALGEEREAEADDEERGRDHGVAGVAGERERGEPQAQRAAARKPLDGAQRRPQQARDEHRRSEGDERGQQQGQVAVSFPSHELEGDEADRRERRRVQEPEAGSRGSRGDGADEDTGRGGRDEQCQPEPFGGEDAAGEHRRRRARLPARRRARLRPPRPRARSPSPPPRARPTRPTVTSASCQPRAPYQASRLRAAARSVRSVIAASSANANSSAAASPPTIPSRRPAARLVACASRSSSTGAMRSKLDVTDCSSERACATPAARSSTSQSRGSPGRERRDPGVAAKDRVQRRKLRRASPTPSARKSGGGAGRW